MEFYWILWVVTKVTNQISASYMYEQNHLLACGDGVAGSSKTSIPLHIKGIYL